MVSSVLLFHGFSIISGAVPIHAMEGGCHPLHWVPSPARGEASVQESSSPGSCPLLVSGPTKLEGSEEMWVLAEV